jgi:RimJ/RimL family protein N-acetyltransferase
MTKRILCTESDKVRVGEWVLARAGGKFLPEIAQAIGLEKDGELIAGAVFESWNGAVVYAHLAIANKYGLNREFLKFGFSYAFNQIKAKKIVGLVASTNLDAIKLDENFGYVLEATIKDGVPDGDMLIYTMTKEQCRFLKD